MRSEDWSFAVGTIGRQRDVGFAVPCFLQDVTKETSLAESRAATLMRRTGLIWPDVVPADGTKWLPLTGTCTGQI
jgi:hypothetical protein